MLRKLGCLSIVLLLCCIASAAQPEEHLILYLPFDEGSGTVATDLASGFQATLTGAHSWTAGKVGQAISFTGGVATLADDDILDPPNITAMAWVNPTAITANIAPNHYTDLDPIYEKRGSGDDNVVLGLTGGDGVHFYVDNGGNRNISVPDAGVILGEWQHVAGTYDGTISRVYLNGEQMGEMATQNPIINNTNTATVGGATFRGAIDEVRVYDRALTQEEILRIMQGDPTTATAPLPSMDATDTQRDTMLSWTPSEYAVKHTVYLGASFDPVNDATVANPMDVLVSADQTDVTYDPGILDFDQTYYWRVDEVNGAPDRTVFKGDVWSFTTEPFSYPIPSVTATASSSHSLDMGPENTVGGVGLNEMDQHSTLGTDMWLSGMGDPTPTLQYAFDKTYKLDKMWVWNSNQLIESFIGMGAKDVVVEYSVDGAAWSVLEGATQFNQAPGTEGYTANTHIEFGGLQARYVKITISAGHGFVPQYGISEVRFFFIPTSPREPQPAHGAGVDSASVTLTWRAGREAGSHEIYLGTDPNDLPLATTTTEATYAANQLNYDTTYYWTIVEVNENEAVATYGGPVWSFTTPAFGIVDSFDQYNDDCHRIFFAWEDGLGHNGGTEIEGCDMAPSNGNGGGSIVGNEQAPFAEKTIVSAGSRQSLPFNYDNAFGDSYTTLAIDGEDWSASAVKTLALAFRGTTGNTGTLYVKINNTKIPYDMAATDIASEAWLAWNIDLTGVSGLQNVTSLTIGVDGANAAGMLYIDDIRLYPLAGEQVTPVAPSDEGLVAYYSFDSSADDMSSNGNHGTLEGGAQIAAGHTGSALDCDGFSAYVSTGISASQLGIDANKPRTVTCWIFTRGFTNGGIFDVGNRSNGQDFCLRTLTTPGSWRVQYWGGAFDIDFTLDALDKWVHITHVYDGSATQVYADGILVAQGPGTLDTTDDNPWQIGVYGWQNDYWDGMIDELRLYSRALTAEEALGAAGKTSPIHKGF